MLARFVPGYAYTDDTGSAIYASDGVTAYVPGDQLVYDDNGTVIGFDTPDAGPTAHVTAAQISYRGPFRFANGSYGAVQGVNSAGQWENLYATGPNPPSENSLSTGLVWSDGTTAQLVYPGSRIAFNGSPDWALGSVLDSSGWGSSAHMQPIVATNVPSLPDTGGFAESVITAATVGLFTAGIGGAFFGVGPLATGGAALDATPTAQAFVDELSPSWTASTTFGQPWTLPSLPYDAMPSPQSFVDELSHTWSPNTQFGQPLPTTPAPSLPSVQPAHADAMPTAQSYVDESAPWSPNTHFGQPLPLTPTIGLPSLTGAANLIKTGAGVVASLLKHGAALPVTQPGHLTTPTIYGTQQTDTGAVKTYWPILAAIGTALLLGN